MPHKMPAEVCPTLLHLLWIGRPHSRSIREETIARHSGDISFESPHKKFGNMADHTPADDVAPDSVEKSSYHHQAQSEMSRLRAAARRRGYTARSLPNSIVPSRLATSGVMQRISSCSFNTLKTVLPQNGRIEYAILGGSDSSR